jgi:hypothetical protein
LGLESSTCCLERIAGVFLDRSDERKRWGLKGNLKHEYFLNYDDPKMKWSSDIWATLKVII